MLEYTEIGLLWQCCTKMELAIITLEGNLPIFESYSLQISVDTYIRQIPLS